jgi:hypothetical protein
VGRTGYDEKEGMGECMRMKLEGAGWELDKRRC